LFFEGSLKIKRKKMNYYKLCMTIMLAGSLEASEQELRSPRNSPCQRNLSSPSRAQTLAVAAHNNLLQTRHQSDDSFSSLGSSSRDQRMLHLVQDRLCNIAQQSTPASPLLSVSSTLAAGANSTAISNVATFFLPHSPVAAAQCDSSQKIQEYMTFQQHCNEFKRQSELFRRQREEILRAQKRQQEQLGYLKQEITKLRSILSEQEMPYDIFRKYLETLTSIEQEAQPSASRVPSLRLESLASSRPSSNVGPVFSLRRHTDLTRRKSDVLDSQQHQQVGDRQQFFQLGAQFVDQTFVNTTTSTTAVAIAMTEARNVINNDDADDEASDGSPLLASRIVGDNCGVISQTLRQRPEIAVPSQNVRPVVGLDPQNAYENFDDGYHEL
jgi:hypothetical protein